LSTALFNKPAFKNVVVNGIILAEDGTKMSKRLKNYPEPEVVINRYGADAIRLYLLSSPAVYGEDLRFSEKGVEQVLRQVLIPLWNSFIFLSTYARIYQWQPKNEFHLPKADIDRWIVSLLQKLVIEVTNGMDLYEFNQAVQPFVGFIDQLTNWYIRRNRGRFWSDVASQDRDEAFATLHYVLITLTKIAAPFIPFLSEEIYQQIKQRRDLPSVHLCDFPSYQPSFRDEKLEQEMTGVQTVVSAGHALRKEHKIKVRQPLSKAFIVTSDEEIYSSLLRQKQLIADELNVKDLVFEQDEKKFVALTAKPNFRILGKKVGKLMNSAQKVIQNFNQKQLKTLLEGKNLEIAVEGETILLTPEDVAVERKVLEGLVAETTQGITVALEIKLNEELLIEGLAREIVNKINTMRRDEGFAVTDRIAIQLQTTDRVKSAFDIHRHYIMGEVLGTQVTFEPCDGTEWDLNGEPTKIAISLSS